MSDVSLVNADGVTVFQGTQVGGGGSQPFVRVNLRHSAAFANLSGNAPVTSDAQQPSAVITLPPSAFGNDGFVNVRVSNGTADDVDISGALVVQNADGTVWLEQDTNTATTVGAGLIVDIDFDTSGGGAGAGLSWGTVAKEIDIASAGVFSAFVTIAAVPTP